MVFIILAVKRIECGVWTSSTQHPKAKVKGLQYHQIADYVPGGRYEGDATGSCSCCPAISPQRQADNACQPPRGAAPAGMMA